MKKYVKPEIHFMTYKGYNEICEDTPAGYTAGDGDIYTSRPDGFIF